MNRLQRFRDDLIVVAAFLAMLAAAMLAGCSSATEPAPCGVQPSATFTPADTVYVGLCVTTWRMP